MAISSLSGDKYDSMFGALYALNGLLPEKYRVSISSAKFNELTKKDINVICGFCDESTKYQDIKIFNLLIPLVEGMVSGNDYEKVWDCPKCNKINKIVKTKMIQKVLAEPFFLKVVPKPPDRKDGLMDRSNYHKKVSKWAWLLLDELEAQMAQFRDDNWHKSDEIYDESSQMGETGEELD